MIAGAKASCPATSPRGPGEPGQGSPDQQLHWNFRSHLDSWKWLARPIESHIWSQFGSANLVGKHSNTEESNFV